MTIYRWSSLDPLDVILSNKTIYSLSPCMASKKLAQGMLENHFRYFALCYMGKIPVEKCYGSRDGHSHIFKANFVPSTFPEHTLSWLSIALRRMFSNDIAYNAHIFSNDAQFFQNHAIFIKHNCRKCSSFGIAFTQNLIKIHMDLATSNSVSIPKFVPLASLQKF